MGIFGSWSTWSRASRAKCRGMLADIVEARVLAGHHLYVRFEDGLSGEVDLRNLVSFTGVFEFLKDPCEVAKIMVDPELGTICWPNGADLDPDVLYAMISNGPGRL